MLPDKTTFFEAVPAQQAKTLCVGCCGQTPSGCHGVAGSIQRSLPQSYLLQVMYNPAEEDDITILPKTAHSPQNSTEIRNLVITGCGIKSFGAVIQSLSKQCNFDSLEHIYIVRPPHLMRTDAEMQQDLAAVLSNPSVRPLSGKIEIIRFDADHYGFPKQLRLPALPEEKEGLPLPEALQAYNGLLYLPKTEMRKAEKYLESFFDSLFKIHKKKAHCLILGDIAVGTKTAIRELASLYIPFVTFGERLPPEGFERLMLEIQKKGGIIGTNGVYSFIQAALLGCENVRFIMEKPCNKGFGEQMMLHFHGAEHAAARAIFGVDNMSYLEDPKNAEVIRRVMQQMQVLFRDSEERYLVAISGRDLGREQGIQAAQTSATATVLEALRADNDGGAITDWAAAHNALEAQSSGRHQCAPVAAMGMFGTVVARATDDRVPVQAEEVVTDVRKSDNPGGSLIPPAASASS